MEIKRSMRMMLALCAVFALTVGVATATAGNGGNSQKKLCYQGGWQTVYGTDGTTFTSQKDCVSYVINGGTLTTTPPPVRFGSLIDCESLGGIYTTGGDYPLWRCLGVYYPDQAHSVAGNETLAADCVAEGGGAYTSLGTIPGTTDAWCHAP